MKKLTKNAISVLEKRYLKKDVSGKPVETPEDMFRRVAANIAKADLVYDPKADIQKTIDAFFEIMASLEFLPNSPTLMNAGRELQQLSACFVLPVEDDLGGIYESLKNCALIHQSGGGTGFSFSRLRPKGDLVKSTMGIASGPISFMEVFNASTEQIKQGGARRGANMGMMRIDHPDILEFIGCKGEEGKLSNFNLSVAVTDVFMEAVKNNTTYPLVNPRTGETVKELNARGVFNTIVEYAHRNGEPGMVFIDKLNKDNPTPHIGEIESTNPCGEQPLLPYESCNLGSINIAGMVMAKGIIDWDRLEYLTKKAVHFLDNVIDMNNYPIPQIEEMTKGNRKIGLGVMGFADMLIRMGIPYDSDAAVRTAEEVMGFIREKGHEASAELAKTRGVFPNFEGSIYKNRAPMRNATVTTIAPTGTISTIAGASSGIEPLFGICFTKTVMDKTELVETNPDFEKTAREKGFYSEGLMKRIAKEGGIAGIKEIPEDVKRLFVSSYDISPECHVRIQAAFQKYTDNAVSKTINFPNSAAVKDVADAYLLASQLGCKGITVYRDGSRLVQVITKGENKAKEMEPRKPVRRPMKLQGETFKYPVGCGSVFVTVNKDPQNNKPLEVFVRLGKSGGCLASQTESFGRLISTALRAGVDVSEIINQLIGVKCDQVAWVGNGQKTESCSDAIGKALREALGDEPPMEVMLPDIEVSDRAAAEGSFCPDCGAKVVYVEGCQKCSAGCGYTKC